MSKITRSLSCLLAVVLLLSCFSVCVFADKADLTGKYKSMLSLGTSVTRGCGLPDELYYGYNEETAKYIEGNYPSMVAKELGIDPENCRLCAYQGQTLSSLLALLDLVDETSDPMLCADGGYNFYYNYWMRDKGYGMKQVFDAETGIYPLDDCIESSDLITIEAGMGDVFYRTKEATGLEELFSGESEVDIAEFAKNLISEVTQNYSFVIKNYTRLLDYIKEHNPNATVVLVGAYNMFADMPLEDDQLLKVGSLLSALSDGLNLAYRTWAEEYGYIYCDISNVDTPATETDVAAMSDEFMDNMNLYTHPSVENGIPYMARQVLSSLAAAGEKPGTNIVVDLGELTNVKTVSVNGSLVNSSGYTFTNHVLTVSCSTTDASLLTVTSQGEDGKVITTIYTLHYDKSTGYRAYRVGSEHDTEATATLAINKIKSLLQSILEKIRSSLKQITGNL